MQLTNLIGLAMEHADLLAVLAVALVLSLAKRAGKLTEAEDVLRAVLTAAASARSLLKDSGSTTVPAEAVKEAVVAEAAKNTQLTAEQLSDLVALLAANGRAGALTEAERAAAAEQGREQRRRFLTPGNGYQPGNAQMFNNGN
ncbi:MAG: hypothetical protein BWY28_02144 [bacterium ADurb.Bin236]|nr:MAG: hypothetical protein BWY28_02144 [bacterium ADurb.Bin236]